MVLAMGKFQVSKYAAPSGAGAAALDFGLGTVGGNQFGVDGAGQLVPSNMFPQIIGPGGEIMPGGGSPFLPGGVPMDPAYAGGGPMWDTSTLPGGGFGGGRRGGRFGSRIINVNLPKLITAGQPFPIIVTYTHVGEAFGTYKVKVNIPVFQIMETSPEKRVASGGQDNIVINLTAPAPLPDAAITGTVELVQTEGNEVTIDSEVITLPTEKVPNPPMPIPPDAPPIPPPVSEPPVIPPPPPVPIPPVLQLVAVTITRGEDGGFQAIIIEASNLDASEPATVFIYLSSKPQEPGGGYGGYGGGGYGNGNWNNKPYHEGKYSDWKEKMVSTQTPAGSTAAANVAYSYPSVSIGGITGAGNGLKLNTSPSGFGNKASSMIPGMFSKMGSGSHKSTFNKIKNDVSNAVQSKGAPPSVAMIAAQAAEMGATMGPAGAASEAAKAVLKAAGSNTTTIAHAGSAVAQAVAGSGGASSSAGGGGGASAAAAAGQAAAASAVAGGASQAVANIAGAAAAAAAGSATAVAVAGGGPPAIAVGEPYPMPLPPPKPIYKRQRVSLTASDAGTIRHVVRVQSATVGMKLHGFVLVYGHRSKKHSGRKPFSL